MLSESVLLRHVHKLWNGFVLVIDVNTADVKWASQFKVMSYISGMLTLYSAWNCS